MGHFAETSIEIFENKGSENSEMQNLEISYDKNEVTACGHVGKWSGIAQKDEAPELVTDKDHAWPRGAKIDLKEL
jgi:hypothetical protein